MKLYKFRPLANEEDYCRLKSIIETGHFRCSNFNDLNDPMEGVFSYNGENNNTIEQKIKEIFDEKHSYKICSFSGNEEYKGLNSPLMRCHYANSFKGVAIEIEIEIGTINNNEKGYIEKVIYENQTMNAISILEVSKILTRKSTARGLEDEHRFLVKSDNNFHKIGKITGIYFGDPYHNISNKKDIINNQNNKQVLEYRKSKKKIEKIIGNKIKKHLVYIKSGEIKIEED